MGGIYCRLHNIEGGDVKNWWAEIRKLAGKYENDWQKEMGKIGGKKRELSGKRNEKDWRDKKGRWAERYLEVF